MVKILLLSTSASERRPCGPSHVRFGRSWPAGGAVTVAYAEWSPRHCRLGQRSAQSVAKARLPDGDRGAKVELPLEHVGPEPKDSAQLCVAENERDRQESTTSARWNNYQQRKLILASSRPGFPRLGLQHDRL